MKPGPLGLLLLLSIPLEMTAQTPTDVVTYSNSDRGVTTFGTTGGTGTNMRVGYARLRSAAGTSTPSGVAIFAFKANDILVSEAAIPLVRPIMSGRTYARVDGAVNTGIAIANPNSEPVSISFYLTDGITGNSFEQSSFVLASGQQIASFLTDAPFKAPTPLSGTLTFNASAPVAVVALRGLTNERGEFLITTQPVADLTDLSLRPTVIGHVADGGGWRTQLVLVNTRDETVTGRVEFYNDGRQGPYALPMGVTINGRFDSIFNFSIPARGSVQLETSGSEETTRVGTARILSGSSSSPSGFALFSFRNQGVVVTEGSVPAQSGVKGYGQPLTWAERTYVETTGLPGQLNTIQTGIAVTNLSGSGGADVAFELFNADGTATGRKATIRVPLYGHISKYLTEIFPGIPLPFRGMVRVTAVSIPFTVTTFRTRYNERGDLLIATIPIADEGSSYSSGDAYFPHIVDLGGYKTSFILFNGNPGQPTSGRVEFVSQSGQPLPIPIADR